MKVKIRLDTMADAKLLVNVAAKSEGKVMISDSAGLCVNAKSMFGALHAMEFNEIWCESEEDLYNELESIVILE